MGLMRRRGLLQEASGGGYVTDGLVFWLDGIDKGEDPTKWEDLVSGAKFTLNDKCVVENNCVNFATTGATASGSPINVLYSAGTIECACSGWLASAFILSQPASSSNSRICLVFGGRSTYINGAISADGISKARWNFLYGSKLISASDAVSVCNKEAVSKGTNDSWYLLAGSTSYIATRNGSGSQYKGRIYSIRIYNRQLTAAEMIQNQEADIARFGISI